jgi:glycine betaine/choline ABC-type transport system substrate-binding protein/ABC-type proline/glycine betaine transport system permease subunit
VAAGGSGDVIGPIDFLLHERTSVGGDTKVGGHQIWDLLGTHLAVSGAALLAAATVALPFALWLGHLGRGQALASAIANAGRAVPTFAVIVFTSTYAVFGLTTRNLAFGLALLAIPPIFINGYVGIRQVDRDIVDAARGMGLTGAQIIRRVELPLALPLIFGGIRTSAVNVVATASLGPFVGVLTLGDWIVNANVYGDDGRIAGALVVALLAIGCELMFAGLQRAVTPRGLRRRPILRRMQMRKITTPLAAALAVLLLAACGSSSDKQDTGTAAAGGATGSDSGKLISRDAANASKPAITVGSKNFTEEYILGEIYAQALEAAGYKVKRQLDLGSEQIAYKALKAGKVDAYPEYTGTALTSFYKVDTAKVPKDPEAAYELVKTDAAKDGIAAFAPTPFTDSNGFAMTQAGAQKIGATKLSDLAGKASSLVAAGPPECRQRVDCLLGLEKVYGLHFKTFVTVDLAKRWEVLKTGQADVSLVFTTDGPIKTDHLVLLQDDKKLFPPYNASLLTRDATAQAAGPDMQKVVEAVGSGLTTAVMQELNSRVDIDKQKPAAVAKEYLQESGYVK